MFTGRMLQIKERTLIITSLLFIFFFTAPLFLYGENAHIRVHDNLDSNIAWYRVLADSGELLSPIDATIPQIMNGLPRQAFASEWSLIVWLHALFPSMLAYAISQLIVRVFAFIGMYVLLKDFFVKDERDGWIRVGVSLTFALTPFWPSGMLSTLGQPLALWAFLRIRAQQAGLREWLVLLLLPFYASFVLGFFFFLSAMALFWLWDLITKRKMNGPFLFGLILMIVLFLLIEYRLVYDTFFNDVKSHRVEFISSRHGFFRSLKLSLKNFVLGHNHVMTVHTLVILPIQLFVLGRILYKREGKKERPFIFLMILNYLLSLWYALWFNNLWIPLKREFDFLNTFNFARFHFLRPLVIYLTFALALLYLAKNYRRRVIPWAIGLQFLVLIPFNEEIHYRFIHSSPSFKEFYAVEQFEEIASMIGEPKENYRVASIGLHPAISQYNGFYTLDMYVNAYPLPYKYKFRKIIEKELDKNRSLKTYFDEWGSRCYIFVAELGKKYDFRKNSQKTIKNLELNTKAFFDLGGRYIFSSVPVENAEENNLILEGVFNHPDSAWTVYLYKVDDKQFSQEDG